MEWKDIIKEIQGYGLSQRQIAAEISSNQAYISQLLRNDKPRVSFEIGTNLLALRDRLRGATALSRSESSLT